MAPELSVVILCYRSGGAARAFAARIREALLDAGVDNYQLVLVGNYVAGSDDTTPDVVRELASGDPRIVCSAVVKQGMMGWDLRSGLALATGRYLAVIDGDGQVLVEDLVRIYRLLREQGLDLAKTYRKERGDGLKRKVISLVFNGLFHVLFPGVLARDINAKPKILTRAAFERMTLQSSDWFIDAEIMIQARGLGLSVGETETEFLGLTGRRSFITLAAVFEFLRNLLRYRILEFRRRDRE
ncbi:MAG: glycosyltransferase [Acidobacteria bacterium]|nr:glycosyltransferase [Acidobacteriota bacterium]MBV9067504.1 glycosyltransferase [Acidobacteriota bacterium]MBV9187900.1 glycosyltransferase [Acidobacteriota bacterium]